LLTPGAPKAKRRRQQDAAQERTTCLDSKNGVNLNGAQALQNGKMIT
jgi:hypothetical protein